jgi:hypothetical protein
MIDIEKDVTTTDGQVIGYVGPKYDGIYEGICMMLDCRFETPGISGGTDYQAFRRAAKILERHIDRTHGVIEFDREHPSLQEHRMRRRLRWLSHRGAARQLWRALFAR